MYLPVMTKIKKPKNLLLSQTHHFESNRIHTVQFILPVGIGNERNC